MDFQLTAEELTIKSQAQSFAEKEIKPIAREIDRSARFPKELFVKMGQLGYYGIPYPEQYGGSGMGYLPYILLCEEIWKASSGVGMIFTIQTLSSEAILNYACADVKREILIPMCEGKSLGCLAFTEPGTGSNPKDIRTKARYENGEYILNGDKCFISGASEADYVVLFAEDEELNKVNAYAVDTSAKGFIVEREIEMLGLRGNPTTQVFIENLRVPEHRLLNERGKGFNVLLDAISTSKLVMSIGAVGLAQAALDMSLKYANERLVYGKPLIKFPTIQTLLAEMSTKIEAGRWLTYRAAHLRSIKGSGLDINVESAQCKLFNAQMAVGVLDMAMQIHGAYGYSKDYEIERIYRDAKAIGLVEGTSEIQRAIVASAFSG